MQSLNHADRRGTMMVNLTYFERLTETVTLLVRHPEYPNKGRALAQCRHEVTELIRAGRISVTEAELLYTILDTYPESKLELAPDGRVQELFRGDAHRKGETPAAFAGGPLPSRRG